jgi:predicted anti-sigma-YlaC factor YlaD
MHCSHAKTDIALLVGGDLDHEAAIPLKAHLKCCADCAGYFASLKRNLGVLRAMQEVPFDPRDSVWPRLMPALSYAEQQRRVKQFNGWVASVAVAAICLAMVTLAAESRRNTAAPYAQDPGSSYDRVVPVRPDESVPVPSQRNVPVVFEQAGSPVHPVNPPDELRFPWFPF